MRFLLSSLFTLALVLLASPTQAYDSALSERLAGRILLQVEERGEAWYVRTSDTKRYYMKDGAAAYTLMRYFSLGITNADLSKIPSVNNTSEMNASESACETNALADRLQGEILLQVEAHGEAWYVDPQVCRRIYMKDGDVAYEIMRFLGLGITNADLEKIESSEIRQQETDSASATEDSTQEEAFDPASHGSAHPKVAMLSTPPCCSHPYYHSVYRAYSQDALSWEKEGVMLQDHASVPAIIQRDDGSYVLYYVDGRYDTMDCQVLQDGRTFTDGDCTIYGFTQEKAWDPYVVRLDEEWYRLYFVSPPSGPGKTTIRSALSQDGISWLEEEGVRFEQDDLHMIDPAVVLTDDGWRMYAWYEPTPGESTMVTATSADGLTFAKESEFQIGGGIPEVLQLDASGLFALYVCSGGISVATSSDGVTGWSALSTVLSADAGQMICDPSIIKNASGQWEMVYKVQEVQ